MLMGKVEAGSVHISAKANQKCIHRVKLSSCTPGMLLAENLYNKSGAVFLRENTVLNENIVKKLHELGIESVKVCIKPTNSAVADNLEKYEIKYKRNLSILKNLFKDFSSGSTIDMKKVDQVSESITYEAEDKDIILKHKTYDNFDDYLYSHSINVGMLVMLIGKWLEYDENKLNLLVKSGLLHDIGKCRIDPAILNKKGPLFPGEYESLKKHAIYGLELLKHCSDIKKDVLMGIIMHHERVNGSGYPKGLKDDEIHEFAKIIAIADIYDAMTSNRVYRQKQSPFDVFEYMGNGCNIGLDVKITLTFLEHVSSYYIGDSFLLNNGELCTVIYINPGRISHPLVQIGQRYVDLSQNSELRITAMV